MSEIEAVNEAEKGRVFVQTSKGVFPFSTLQAHELRKSSKQVTRELRWAAAEGLVHPPYPPESFLTLFESNAIFYRCVIQIAIDVAGLGWKLHLREGQKENKAEYARLRVFLDKPNPDQSLREVVKQLLVDWGSVGWFGIEVVRNVKGGIVEIYHVPAYTFRIHQSKEKFCQSRNNSKVWFKAFGSEKSITSKEGKEGITSPETGANELIYCKNFYPKSDYYGVPNIIAAVGDVTGLIALRDYNLAFFENHGVPSALIILEGGWEKGSDKKISDYLNTEVKSTQNAYRTLVVTQPTGCNFTYTPMTTEVKEGSFKLYELARREDVMVAYGMPPERIGIHVIGKLAGNVAEEATKIYVHSVVEPLQLDIEDIINSKLLVSTIYEFKFENVDIRDYDAEVDRLSKLVGSGMLTPNEARQELGRMPYPEGDKFYVNSSLIEVGAAEETLSKVEKEFFENETSSCYQ